MNVRNPDTSRKPGWFKRGMIGRSDADLAQNQTDTGDN